MFSVPYDISIFKRLYDKQDTKKAKKPAQIMVSMICAGYIKIRIYLMFKSFSAAARRVAIHSSSVAVLSSAEDG